MSSNEAAPLAAQDAAAHAAIAAKPSEWGVIWNKILSGLGEAKAFLGIATEDVDAAQPVIATVLGVVNPGAAAVEGAAVGALNGVNAVVQAGSVTVALANLHNAVDAVDQVAAAVKAKPADAGGTPPPPIHTGT
jgi:hypothetical protein